MPDKIVEIKNKVIGLSLTMKIVIALVIIGGGWFAYNKINSAKTSQPTYQTAQVEKGTLITTVTASGNITAGNNLTISTTATGTVRNVYVKNGDTVKAGQKIAIITLDQDALQRQASAWASYLSAKNNVQTANDKLNSLQAAEFTANQKFMNDAVARDLETTDPTYIEENASWLQAEADYKNQYNAIQQAQASLTSAWYSYQQVSPTITSPADGVISNLMIANGTVISANTSSNNSVTSQQLGTIKRPNETTQATVALSEIDAAKVNPDQKVTITMDAYPDKTFTGKVLVVNTNGSVSSGVTTYPATIQFDTASGNIYPNMAVTAKIITQIKDNVLLVPSSAVITSNGQSNLRELKNGVLTNIPVIVGDSNDTQTEIISGVNEGDTIVTSVVSRSSSTNSSTTTSPFGARTGGFGGGALLGR